MIRRVMVTVVRKGVRKLMNPLQPTVLYFIHTFLGLKLPTKLKKLL